MGRVTIIHHRLLRTAILDALAGPCELAAVSREAARRGLQPIMVWVVNRCWLEIIDDSHLFGAWSAELRKACSAALDGIVEI